jgi:hypothetical protein
MAENKVVDEVVDPEEEERAKRAKIGWILFFSSLLSIDFRHLKS